MARTNYVKHARKPQGKCMVCRTKEINIGDPYQWVKPRYGMKIKACMGCNIPITMTSSSKMARIWDEIQNIDRDDYEGCVEVLRQLAATVREVSEEYQAGVDSQREYFPDSPIAEENEEKAQNLESWADDIDTAAQEAEDKLEEMRTEILAFYDVLDQEP